jgi:hypothetical protein
MASGSLLGRERRIIVENSLLIETPKTYAHWWTFVPVLPSGRNDPAYLVLKRQWCDHTMNCIAPVPGGWKLKSNRGFYVEPREDHIATVLFHIWAAFPDTSWVGPLLDLWDIAHGEVSRVRWSYSWEQKSEKSKRPDITDIVLSWEDEEGQAVIIIETKRAGGKLTEKDLNGGVRYLDMPSIRPFERKYMVYLVDEGDLPSTISALPSGTPATSWQQLGQLQADLIENYESSATHGLLKAYISKHYYDLGMPFAQEYLKHIENKIFTGTQDRYQTATQLGLADSLERFLIGSEVTFCARSNRMPELPYAWLADEPSFPDVVSEKSQTTQDRGKPLWRLPQ